MRKGTTVVVLLVALVVLFGTQVFAAGKAASGSVSPVIDRIMAKKELVVGTAASMPPLNMTMKDGQIAGLEMDLARGFAASMEVKVRFKTMHFNELLPALKAGKVDMVLSGMTMTPGRNLKVAFAGPYFDSGKSILAKKANASSLDSIEKLDSPDKTLVALKGSTSQQFAEKMTPRAKLLLAQDYAQAVAMVRDGKAVAMVADFPICLLSTVRYPDADFATLDKPLTYEPIGVALHPGDQLLVNWVQNVINALQKSGDIDVLLVRWFKQSDWIDKLP